MNSMIALTNLFKDEQIMSFFNWLLRDKRRLININKILNILIKNQENPLTFSEISEKTSIRKMTLSEIIKKLRLLRMLADYDIENIVYRTTKINTTKDYAKAKKATEYSAKDEEIKLYYRYRYKFINFDRTTLILAAIWGLNFKKKSVDN